MDIEAVRFAEDILIPSDFTSVEVWMFRQFEALRMENPSPRRREKVEKRPARWGGTPWPPDALAAFADALREERWFAVRKAGMLSVFPIGLPEGLETDARFRRWARLSVLARSGDLKEFAPPTEAELTDLAGLLRRDAPRTAHIRPVLRVCDATCPAEPDRCLATAVLLHGARIGFGLDGLEPVLPMAAWLDSWRAERQVLVAAGNAARRDPPDAPPRALDDFGPEWLRMPQCFRAAATAAADRVSPPEP